MTRKTIEQKIADLQRKQRFELLRGNVKEHIAEVKAAMAARNYVEARDCFSAGAATCQALFDLTVEVAESEE